MLTNEQVRAYLARLGVDAVEPPSLTYLTALHQAHVENLSWQTIDIVAGKPMPIDVQTSVGLIINGRSGYCFHLNGAFGELLRSLGYNVTWHRAGVQPLGQEPSVNGFHLGLTVSLPGEQEGARRWIVDVGLGDMPHMPLPLLKGDYEQGAYRYRVVPSSVTEGGWRLEHDPLATFAGVDFASEPVECLDPFVPKHEFYSRSPESPWFDLFLVRQRHGNGGNELRGCMWSRREGQTVHQEELSTKSRWLEVLADIFQERLVAYSALERDELWKKVYRLHETWKKRKTQLG